MPFFRTKDGNTLVENDHIKLFPNTTLYIASANQDDMGEYTCKTGSMPEPKVFNVVGECIYLSLLSIVITLILSPRTLTTSAKGNYVVVNVQISVLANKEFNISIFMSVSSTLQWDYFG